MNARIAGTGMGLPAAYDQRALWDRFFRDHFAGTRSAERIFRGSGVDRRHCVTDPAGGEDVSGWSTGRRMRRYRLEAPVLARAAVRGALAQAGTGADEIGLLVVATCTGYGTPGVDVDLAATLPLRPDAQRLLVGHIGCHAALPALGSAADYVAARGRPAVVLCLELTTLHLRPSTGDPAQAVTHALFGDAAAAVVLRPEATGGPRVVDVAAITDTDHSADMTWDVTDLGFAMGLAAQVPDVLGEHVGPLVKDLLSRNGLDVADVRGWAVHPGGPRILDTVADRLDLPEAAMAASRAVLAAYGNCSSATVLLVLRELLARGHGQGPIVALAFGPGLTLYAALLLPD